MASTIYGAEGHMVQLYVDGQYYDEAGDLQMPVSGSATADIYFDLDSETFANGSHTLEVTDGVNSQTISTSFSNTLSNFSI